jgi:hypothetical protein
MTGLSALWLPILLSAVFVFVASSIIHMLSPWHKSDYPKVLNEDKVMEALRPFAIPQGDYMMPRPSSRQDLRSPEFAEKRKKGPRHDLHCYAERFDGDGDRTRGSVMRSCIIGK